MTVEERRAELRRLQFAIEAAQPTGGWGWTNCPACNYPGHGESDPRKKYMGIYRPGEPCDMCGHRETVS